MLDLVDLMISKVELSQAYKNRKAIDDKIAALEKKMENDRRFYIGEKFFHHKIVYQLIKHSDKVALVAAAGDESQIGWATKNGWHKIPIGKDCFGRFFVNSLPTTSPEDFGLDGKYGWYY